jgi:glycosyltransferase involved in cell wall biosynthesis
MPKVTVVIPCYNDGRYIDDAVDSILHQTYKGLDIIIVNDGADDKYTARLLSDFIRPKTRVIHVNYRNPGAARNHGIRDTDSKYILTLDADDKFEKTFLGSLWGECTRFSIGEQRVREFSIQKGMLGTGLRV